MSWVHFARPTITDWAGSPIDIDGIDLVPLLSGEPAALTFAVGLEVEPVPRAA